MVMVMENNRHYQTTDTALAAYLKSSGYEVIEIDTSNQRAVFIFEDCDGLRKYIEDFELIRGNAEGVVLFFRAYRTLLSKIHILKQMQE